MYRWSHLLLLPGLLGLVACGDGDDHTGSVDNSITTLYSSGAVAGEKGLLRISLGNPASGKIRVSLSSSAPDVIELPSSVTFPEGSRSLDIEFEGKATGTTAIRAAVGESTAMATASVVESLQLTSFYGPSSAYVVGSTGTLSAELNAAVSSPRSIEVTSSSPEVVDVQAGSEFAPFDWWAPIGFTALAVGHADIAVEFDGTTRTYGIQVVERAELEKFGVSERVQVGAIVRPYVDLSAVSTSDSAIGITSDNPEVLPVPEELIVPGGATEGSFTAVAATPGTATLKAEYGGSSLTRTISVVEDVALERVVLTAHGALPAGTSTELLVEVDALVARDVPVSISVDRPEVLSVPDSMLISAGDEYAQKSIVALAEGTAEITVTVGDSTRTVQVEVVEEPAVLYVNAPDVMTRGTSDRLYVELDAPAGDADIMVSSSDEEVVSVTSTVSGSSIQGTVTAHKPGSATITIRVGDNFSTWLVSVVTAPTVDFVSFSSPIVTGTAGELAAYLNAPAPKASRAALESSDPAVLEVPSDLSIPAGATNVRLPLIVGKPGTAILSLTLNGVTRTTGVYVVDRAGFSLAHVAPGSIAKGDTAVLKVSLSAIPKEDVELEFTYETDGIVSGPAKGVIPAGTLGADFLLTGLAQGSTTILVEGGGESTVAGVYVAEKVEIGAVHFYALLMVGQSGLCSVSLNVTNAKPVTVTLESDDPDVLSAPEKVVIPAGAQYAQVPIKGLGVGSTTLRASYDGVEVGTTIEVIPPPAP